MPGVAEGDLPVPPGNVAAVVENGHARRILEYGRFHPFGIAEIYLPGIGLPVFRLLRVKPLSLHPLYAVFAQAGRRLHNVEKHAVEFSRIAPHDLFRLGGELVQIRSSEAQTVIPRVQQRRRSGRAGADAFRVFPGIMLVKTGRDINLCAHAQLTANLQLFVEQIKIQAGMPGIDRRVEIRPAVMALGKQRDGIDMPHFQGLRKIVAGKARTNPGIFSDV